MDSEKIPTSELRSSMENLRPYVEPQAEQEELAMDVDHTPTLPGERKEGWKGKGKGKTSMPPPKHSIYTGKILPCCVPDITYYLLNFRVPSYEVR